jgi:flagellar biosynthesis protein FlhB
MDESELDRSETATPFKLRRAREKGTVPRGVDLGFFAALGAFVAFAWLGGSQAVVGLARLSGATLGSVGDDREASGALIAQMATLFSAVTAPLLAFAGTLFAVVLLVDFLQVGPVFSAQILKPYQPREGPQAPLVVAALD